VDGLITSYPAVLIICGGFFLVIGIFGNKINTKWFYIKEELPNRVRTLCDILGAGFFIGAFIVFFIFVAPQKNDGKLEPPTVIHVSDTKTKPVIDIEGTVIDVFGDAKKDVVVTTKESNIYDLTNKDGNYRLPKVEYKDEITIEARYGYMFADINPKLDSNKIGDSQYIDEPIILDPITKIEAKLCKIVTGDNASDFVPEGIFTNSQISIQDLGTNPDNNSKWIWCYVEIFGPYKYETKEKTIQYAWYYNGELVALDKGHGTIDFDPIDGGRDRASKNIFGTGDWKLIIKAAHKEWKTLNFEIY
jgi:hypothetical protein